MYICTSGVLEKDKISLRLAKEIDLIVGTT